MSPITINSSVRLSNILNCIHVGEFYWKLLWIEAISDGWDILTFEKKVCNSSDGYPISPEELLWLSLHLEQEIEIVLIGAKDENILSVVNKGDECLKNDCDYFIELIDSSLWEVWFKDQKNIECLSRLPSAPPSGPNMND